VEDLLAKRISYLPREFRTPMTLILGPIKDLQSTPTATQHQTLKK
jgi:hypothetical protein